ncbi:Por secretion system C-terminal sorting domain-containing protein [Chitinophaga sp. CF118]|uniref:Ig-like domain-containing protein n=1 Tax=Chitinophaga sp. CF118 TaxID=1884367 RepID=UPI0008ED14A1|nr:Ig-like domain-containing protein [Chitinophaga sp. CF118]SFD84050.1 Por secretion system C-terminal sorting domain-containing protein [Chitinophaga sp. CF118]
MKTPLLIIGLFLVPVFVHAQQKLVWEENFDGNILNLQNWTYETGDGCSKGNCGWGNAELEYYTNSSNNVRVENGHLVIQARREDVGGKPFTSGRIKTSGRVAFKYGTLEARIKVPQVGNGLWPAFWMLGSTGGTWPHNGEVDILEMGFAGAIAAGKANKTVSAATHWWTENPGGYTGHASYARDTVSETAALSDDYHLYKLVWDKSFLTIYLDNSPYYKIALTGGNGLDAFNNPFYILLNLAVGGNYPGIHSAAEVTAPLPGAMEVDYIRLYQDLTQGEQLILGTDNAPEGNYGIFTETTTVNDKVTFGQGANLYYWNNITDIPAPVPFEGNSAWAFHASAGNWFGLGVSNDDKNMSNFASGSLKFNLKTTSTATFKVGISTGSGESWVLFNGTNGEHGLVRDGQWHQVIIPVSEFGSVDLMTVNQLFMFAGDAPAVAADFYVDNVYYTGGVSDNPAPVVTITSPANDTLYTTPASIVISTNTTDSNGSISKVDFFNGDNYLATVTAAPFNYNWQTSVQGIATLIAKATDNQQKTTTSKPVTVFIAAPGNTAPQINITSPTPATTLLKPAKVNIAANVTDDGTIYKVEFYNGAILLGTVSKAPYTFTWNNVDMGTYTITAKAYDNGKLSTVSQPVTFTVQDNKILSEQYGVYTNDAAITTKLTYGQDANLYVWNNLTTIANAAPYEGTEVIAFTAAPGNWFGLGVANDVRDLSHFSNGYLKFWFKTTYQGSFKFSVIASNGQVDISYAAGEQKLGLIRDGQWHEVTIPVNTFTNIDLSAITQVFTFSGDAPAAAADFYIDHVYYTTGNTTGQGPNLALNKPAIASTTENPTTEAIYAVDGNVNTRWSSAFADPQWISVDLGADYNINEVKITWEAAIGKDYQVQISTDQISWTTLKNVTANTALINDYTGLSGHGRYLRIYGTARVTVYGYSIFELEAYGSLHATTGLLGLTEEKTGKWVASLYPNPVAGSQVQVSSSEAVKQIKLVDLSGRVWSNRFVRTAATVYPVDISRIPQGMYLIQVTNTWNETLLLKFIKQ